MAKPDELDLRLILSVPLGQLVSWLLAVLLISWAGYPGVICVTPVAWLIALRVGIIAQFTGYIHLALAVGSQAEVDALTERLRADGFRALDGPPWTGDGYYESVVLDPDGNRIEITI